MEKYAEQVEVRQENPRTVRLCAYLLEPVRHRVGLILLDGGPSARVVSPLRLEDAGRELARTLLDHYQSGTTPATTERDAAP